MTVEEDAIEFCKSKRSEAWFALARWLKKRNFLIGRERAQCFNMGSLLSQNREPSENLSKSCVKIWAQSKILGWEYDDGQK